MLSVVACKNTIVCREHEPRPRFRRPCLQGSPLQPLCVATCTRVIRDLRSTTAGNNADLEHTCSHTRQCFVHHFLSVQKSTSPASNRLTHEKKHEELKNKDRVHLHVPRWRNSTSFSWRRSLLHVGNERKRVPRRLIRQEVDAAPEHLQPMESHTMDVPSAEKANSSTNARGPRGQQSKMTTKRRSFPCLPNTAIHQGQHSPCAPASPELDWLVYSGGDQIARIRTVKEQKMYTESARQKLARRREKF